MTEPIRLDIVDLDDGYFSFYVDGHLDGPDQHNEHLGDAIADYVRGKTVTHIKRHCLGSVGMDAVGEECALIPERFEDIPSDWWLERWEVTKSE